MFTNCRSFNDRAVVNGNTEETSIIRCNNHQVMFTNCCNFNDRAVVLSGNTD